MSMSMPSFLNPSPAPSAPAGGAKAARQALKDVRLEARQLTKAAPAPAPTVSPLGAYNPQAWSLVQDLEAIVHSLQNLIAGWLAPAQPTRPPKGPKGPKGPKPPKNDQPSNPAPTQPVKGRTQFTVSSFNILGSGHTGPGGDAKGYATGVARIRGVIDLLASKSVEVVGFQEMANDQAKAFKAAAGKDYGLFPGPTKKHLGSHNSIAWRKDTFDLVKAYTVDMPSHLGRNQPSPVVRLRNKQTGQEVVVMNFHNAPGYHKNGAQQQWRDKASAMQVDLVNQVRRETGLPVIVTGDMNDKEIYYRQMANGADMNAAIENKAGQLPRGLFIDWIFGSQDVAFKGFKRDVQTIQRKISDHGMLTSEATIGKAKA